jgi:hypothetical protein
VAKKLPVRDNMTENKTRLLWTNAIKITKNGFQDTTKEVLP